MSPFPALCKQGTEKGARAHLRQSGYGNSDAPVAAIPRDKTTDFTRSWQLHFVCNRLPNATIFFMETPFQSIPRCLRSPAHRNVASCPAQHTTFHLSTLLTQLMAYVRCRAMAAMGAQVAVAIISGMFGWSKAVQQSATDVQRTFQECCCFALLCSYYCVGCRKHHVFVAWQLSLDVESSGMIRHGSYDELQGRSEVDDVQAQAPSNTWYSFC